MHRKKKNRPTRAKERFKLQTLTKEVIIRIRMNGERRKTSLDFFSNRICRLLHFSIWIFREKNTRILTLPEKNTS